MPRLGDGIRIAIVAVGFVILGSDLGQDLSFFAVEANRKWDLLASALVRNVLLLVGLAAFGFRQRWGAGLLLLAALLGLIRRAFWMEGSWSSLVEQGWASAQVQAFHSGADLLFRLVLLGVVFDVVRRVATSDRDE